MRVFGADSSSPRGCFVAFDVDMGGSSGAVVRLPEVSSIKSLPNQDAGQANYPLVVVSLAFSQKELAAFLRGFGGHIYTYTFGEDLGELTVAFIGFLSGGRSLVYGQDREVSDFSKVDIIEDFLTAYKQSRVSASKKLATVSLGGRSYLQGFIVGMDSTTMAIETNLQSFNLRLKLVEVQGGLSTREA